MEAAAAKETLISAVLPLTWIEYLQCPCFMAHRSIPLESVVVGIGECCHFCGHSTSPASLQFVSLTLFETGGSKDSSGYST